MFLSANLGPSILPLCNQTGSQAGTGTDTGTYNGQPRQGREFRCIQPSGNLLEDRQECRLPLNPGHLSLSPANSSTTSTSRVFRLFPAVRSSLANAGLALERTNITINLQTKYVKFRAQCT